MSNNGQLNFTSNTLSEFKKAAVWSFRLAWKTLPNLFLTIIICFSLDAIIPVVATAAIGIAVHKFGNTTLQLSTQYETLMFWLGLVLLLLVIEFIITEILNYSRIRMADETGINFQKELYSHTAKMDIAFFEKSESLNKLFLASAGGNSSAFGPIQNTLTAATGIVQIVSLFALMFYLQPLLASLLLLAEVPLLLIRMLCSLEKYNLNIRTTQQRRLSRYFTSRLSGAENILVIKALNLADEMIDRFEKVARATIFKKTKILKKISIRLCISFFFYLAVIILVVVWLSYSFSLGTIEAGSIVAFMLAVFKTLRSSGKVSNAMASGADAALLIVPLLDFLKEEPKILDKGGYSPDSIRGEIVIEKVSFIYPDTNKKVISDLSISVGAGEKVAIVGGNGAGKTTLSKLIARFYEVSSGKILIDGINIKDFSLKWLHNNISLVFQKPTQFEASVYDNIAFGDWKKLKGKKDEIYKIADRVGITDFIKNLPDGFDTHLGKLFGNVTLSQGQWQLLTIARAMARENAIVLFDEPTSNLDIKSEVAMFRAIRNYAKDKTIIFTSHRFSTIKEADRILVLDEGQLVEDGTHNELAMVNEGYYAAMVKHQKSEQRL